MSKQRCMCCGAPDAMVRFEGRTFTVTYQQVRRDVPGLAGSECGECGEVEFDASSANHYAKAGDELIEDARQAVADEIKRIRKKLHRTQKQMVVLSGGGHNAFSRYERAEVEPPQALVVLMAILDLNPGLLEQVEALFGKGGHGGIQALVAEKERARLPG